MARRLVEAKQAAHGTTEASSRSAHPDSQTGGCPAAAAAGARPLTLNSKRKPVLLRGRAFSRRRILRCCWRSDCASLLPAARVLRAARPRGDTTAPLTGAFSVSPALHNQALALRARAAGGWVAPAGWRDPPQGQRQACLSTNPCIS